MTSGVMRVEQDHLPLIDRKSNGGTAESYNDFVYALARKFTSSPDEAEAAVQEMLSDIKRSAGRGLPTIIDRVRARIALLRLMKYLK